MLTNLLFKQKYSWPTIILSAIAAISLIVAEYSFSLLIQAIIDKNFNSIVVYTIAILSLYLLTNISGCYRGVVAEKLLQDYSGKLRKRAINKFCNDLEKSENKNNGSTALALNTTDIQLFEEYASQVLIIIYTVILSIFAMLTIIKINIYIFFISVVLSLIMFFLPKYFDKKIKITTKEISKEIETFNNNLENGINSANMLNNFSSLGLLKNIVEIGSSKIKTAKVNRIKSVMLMRGFNATLNATNQILLTFISGVFAYKGYIEFSMIFAISSVTGNFFSGLVQTINLFPNVSSAKEILAKYPENESKEEKEYILNLNKYIKFSNISYSYDKEAILFPDILIEKNKKYIIQGKSGSGKSTLINILSGNLKNYNGSILWDNKEIRDFETKSSISIMEQKVQILNMSIKDNILLEKEFDEYNFKKSLENSGLLEIINKLENKEDTILDSKNLSLSGGELQRIALARAFYHKKDLLIIDEGTANLDEKLANNIETLMFKQSNLTLIMITHHLSEDIKKLADEIIYLDK